MADNNNKKMNQSETKAGNKRVKKTSSHQGDSLDRIQKKIKDMEEAGNNKNPTATTITTISSTITTKKRENNNVQEKSFDRIQNKIKLMEEEAESNKELLKKEKKDSSSSASRNADAIGNIDTKFDKIQSKIKQFDQENIRNSVSTTRNDEISSKNETNTSMEDEAYQKMQRKINSLEQEQNKTTSPTPSNTCNKSQTLLNTVREEEEEEEVDKFDKIQNKIKSFEQETKAKNNTNNSQSAEAAVTSFDKIQKKIQTMEGQSKASNNKLKESSKANFDKVQQKINTMEQTVLSTQQSLSTPIETTFDKVQHKIKTMEQESKNSNDTNANFDKVQHKIKTMEQDNNKKITSHNNSTRTTNTASQTVMTMEEEAYDKIQDKINRMEKTSPTKHILLQQEETFTDELGKVQRKLRKHEVTTTKNKNEAICAVPSTTMVEEEATISSEINAEMRMHLKMENETISLQRESLQENDFPRTAPSPQRQSISSQSFHFEDEPLPQEAIPIPLNSNINTENNSTNRGRFLSNDASIKTEWLPGDEVPEDSENSNTQLFERSYIIEGEQYQYQEAIIGVAVDPVIEGVPIIDYQSNPFNGSGSDSDNNPDKIQQTIYACIKRGITCFIFVVIVVVLGIALTNRTPEYKTSSPTLTPSQMPSLTPSMSPSSVSFVENMAFLTNAFYSQDEDDNNPLKQKTSPQYKALEWLTYQDESGVTILSKNFLQRFVTAIFYYSTNGPNWTTCSQFDTICLNNQDNYLSNSNECDWYGNFCPAGDWRISQLSFGSQVGNNLKGSIPTEISHLSELWFIDFTNNKLSSTIPTTIGNLTKLRQLNIYNNSLQSPLPDSLFELKNIDWLLLYGNKFKENLSSKFGQLQSLTRLNIFNNSFYGSIPLEFIRMRNLTQLILESNELSGTIPNELYSSLVDLELFRIANNVNITGTIPTNIGLYQTNLQQYIVYNCSLSGTLPSESLFNISSLEVLDISYNNFQGSISTLFGKLNQLSFAFMHGNSFIGDIPSTFGDIPIQTLTLHDNNLTGTMPSSICNMRESSLRILTADCDISNLDDNSSFYVACNCCTSCF